MKNHFASAAAICLMVMCLFAHHSAFANAHANRDIINSTQSGTLLMKSANDSLFKSAKLLDTRVNITVAGMLARTQLNQSFSNDSDQWLEAVYVFPLPDNASVDSLTMTIGERTINGRIQTREQARKTYDRAKNTGRKASLLEQQRANLFTSRVANIPPGEKIEITIAFQSQVRYLDGSFSLNFPLTITPRYMPGHRLKTTIKADTDQSYRSTDNGWGQAIENRITAGDEITPPMVATELAAETTITINIDPGLPLESVVSGSHEITTVQNGDSWQVQLANTRIPMDRDFQLSWHPIAGQSPHAAIFRQDRHSDSGSDSYASIMLIPPQDLFEHQTSLREVIFVIDTSGSMQGNSIKQARSALRMGIDRLSDQDTFNVIEFDNDTHTLYPTAVAATPENRQHAISWVSALYADGGTEIGEAIDTALATQTPDANRLRQVIFITDGSVGNEEEIFQHIERDLKDSRLFTIAIGSAPNTWFMRKAAELGRGSYTSIARDTEVSEKMLELFNKLERPVLTNIALNWQGVGQPELYPSTIPDLYAGEPVLADARWNNKVASGELIISGSHSGQQWKRHLSLGTPSADTEQADSQLYKLWARRKIESLEDSLLFNADPGYIKNEITSTALDYGLVSKYTSLVAVEDIVERDPLATPLASAAVPSAMPSGNTMPFPQGSLGITMRIAMAMVFSLLAVLFSLATLQQVRIDD